MLELNRILIQVNEAVNLANSALPQKRLLAVIIFDNLIEVQLRNKANNILLSDDIGPYRSDRQFGAKARKKILSNIEGLIRFAKENEWINDQEASLLNFAHEIRNKAYHQGETEEYLKTIAIIIYISFCRSKIKDWKGGHGLVAQSDMVGYAPIDFGQPIKFDFRALMQNPVNYYTITLEYILDKYNSPSDDRIQELLSKNLLKQIATIEYYLKEIKAEMRRINFYKVLAFCQYHVNDEFSKFAKREISPKNLDSIFSIYSIIRENGDALIDIDEYPMRFRKYRALLRGFRKANNKKYPYWVDLEIYKKNILSLLEDNETRAIQRGLQFEKNILNLFKDATQAAFDLSGYKQEMYDFYRDK
ncbi:MAG: hypothetical protein ACOYOA_14270 [Saprospiraceae bacterium]